MGLLRRTILNKNAPLKVLSLILGYTFWHVFGNIFTITLTTSVPLCFYNTPDNMHINAPHTIAITLAGKRAQLQKVDLEHLAIHIDAHAMRTGNYPLAINNTTLFLPDSIKLVHYEPVPLMITTQNNHT